MIISSIAGPLTVPDIYASDLFDAWECCDHGACPAQALVYVSTPSGTVVLCGHHGDRVPGALPLPGTWRVMPASAEASEQTTEGSPAFI